MRQKKAQEKNSLKNSSKHPVFVNKQSFNSSDTQKFNKSDIVWAKITGYPWWPAIVTTVPGQKDINKRYDDMRNNYRWSNVHHNVKAQYRVDFIADETHAFLKKNFLLNYLSNRDRLFFEGLQFSTRKRRYFQMAVNEADQLQQVMELSKNQVYQCKHNQSEEELESMESESDSQISESQGQQNQNDSESQESQQKLSTPQNSLTRLRKLRMNKIRKDEQSILVSNQSKSCFLKKIARKDDKFVKYTTDQNLNGVNSLTKRGRPAKKPKIITQIDTKRQSQQNKCQIERNKNLFMKFEIRQQDIKIVSKNNFQEKQQNFQQISAELLDQNEERSIGVEKLHLIYIPNQIDSQHKKTEKLVSDLLTKYNLNKIDEIEENFKNKKTLKGKQQNFLFFQNSGSSCIKTNNEKDFIKNIFSGLGKKKNSKKNHHQKVFHSQNDVFSQNLSIIGKPKQNDEDIISQQLQKFLIETSKKYTARKIYLILMNILKKNNAENLKQQVQTSIRQRCKRISSIIYDQDQIELNKNQSKLSLILQKKSKNIEGNNFLSVFKRKIEKNVNFVKFFSMQNWDFISQMSLFPTELFIQVKSFQTYLQKSCNLKMRNEQKFEDIVKQIGIENEKTAFSFLHQPNEMQIENDDANVSSGKFVISQGNQCNLKNQVESNIIQTK